jgi:SAM-dependent methyltransferase
VPVKRTARLALRNQPLLLEVLRAALPGPAPAEGVAPARPLVLELGSGTGEHALALARALPWLDVQPSDPDPAARASIAAWSAEAWLPNLRAPLDLDLLAPAWRRQPAAALLCVNVLHLAPPAAATSLLDGAAALLPPGGPLVVYGPFRPAAGRLVRLERFDAELRASDPRLGIPSLAGFRAAAAARGLAVHAERAGAEEGDVALVLRR